MFATKQNEEPDPEARQATEYERLLSYREMMFERVGFNPMQAIALAESGADWHFAEKLLENGCPPNVAVDILLP